jgi:hypothetical protein
MRAILAAVAILLLVVLAWFGYWLRPQRISFSPVAGVPVWSVTGGHQAVSIPKDFLAAEIFRSGDEFFAYLMYDYMRSAPALRDAEVLLTYREAREKPFYTIVVHLRNDLLSAVPLLAQIQAAGLIPWFEWQPTDERSLQNMRRQTAVFVSAYNLPVHRKLEQIGYSRLHPYLQRFIRFKSDTDRRVLDTTRAPADGLSDEEAGRLAADIIAVADFYSVPLDFFLGIGAMENNYLNVDGDLEHTSWKRHAQKGDVVLKRRRRRVLVLNQASGVWQITRETLRYAHRLFLKDQRDYSLLPVRLRPPKDLDLDHIDPEVLTTYAGLLFRDLLDRFDGDVVKAAAAYNGGPGNPNMRYADGVGLVAGYARRVLEGVAMLHGQSIAETTFIGPAPP